MRGRGTGMIPDMLVVGKVGWGPDAAFGAVDAG
jgi:hypothetical protein